MTLWNYPDLARCLGVDPYAILASSGLRASMLEDAENWLPGKQILNVLEETARAANRDDFGVLLGEYRTFASLGPVSLLLKHEMTIRCVITSMIRYRNLINELLRLRLDEGGKEGLLMWSLIPGLTSSQGVNLLATIAYRVLVNGTDANWHPECVHFRHAAPTNLGAFTRVFRCPIEFDSTFDGMSFDSGSLDLANACADAELTAHAHRLLELIPGVRLTESVSDRVRSAIAVLLPQGDATCTKVAECLGLTSRSLQRRLQSEGESFGRLLNSVRRDVARRYLKDSTHSATVIADLTGFFSLSSFTRWFAAEFGLPPREWKRSMQGAPSPGPAAPQSEQMFTGTAGR